MSDTETDEVETEETEGELRARMELHENFVQWYWDTYEIDLNELDAANVIAHFSSRRAAWRKSETYLENFGKEARAARKEERVAAREAAKAERAEAKRIADEEKAAKAAAAEPSDTKPKSGAVKKAASGATKKAAPAKRTAKKSAPKASDEVFD